MQPPTRTGSFSSCTVKTVKGNVVVPLGLSDGQLDAAEGGASPFGLGSPLQADRLGARPLGRLSNGGSGLAADPLSPDVSISQTKSEMADVSVSYGRQQSRLAAQLAAKKLRRPSQLQESLRLDKEGEQAEEVGPWGLLKKDTEAPSWRARAKQRIQRLSQSLLVRPGNSRLQYVFYVCVVMALLSGWEVPFHFAFVEPGGLLAPYYDWLAITEYLSTLVFFLDFLLKFSVMYIDPDSGVLVSSRRKIAHRYVTSWQFYMDFVGWFPADWITIDTAASLGVSDRVLTGLAWIKMLTLVRMYRVFELFADLDYRMVLSQGTLMLTRNYTYVFYTIHWAACILYHVAAHQSFSPQSWVGRNAERVFGRPVYEKYLLSLYFSVTAFTGLGDAELFASSVPEQAFMIVYLLFNLFLGAYILGTVTMLVVKGDERSKAFRERMTNLNDFSKNNELPERLQTAMQEHLEVTFNTEQVDDEHVLGIYPTTIRRKVLRHLYMQPVRNCYLFKGCKQRFLDALLTIARVELFMPAVQLLIEGDNVTELNIIVSGEVLVAEAGINLSAAFSQFATSDPSTRASRNWRSSDGGGDPNGSMALGKRTPSMNRTASMSRMNSVGRNSSVGRTSSCNGSIKDFLIDGTSGFMEMATGKKVMPRYSGDALAEVPFFTDVPSNETIMSQSVVRVLSIPKAAWEELMDQFPQQARLVLTNLQHRTENALSQELQSAVEVSQLTEEQLRTSLQQGKNKRGGKNLFKMSSEPPVDLTELLPQHTIDYLNRLDDARAIVRAHVRKVDQLRTFEFLGVASDGDIEALRTMLNQGMNPNSADYDGRTGLMLASSGGHEGVVRLLLDSGAKSDQLDAFGNSAMCEAVKNAHDEVIDVLLSYGATLAMDAMAVASVMCTAVFEGDLVKLRRLLRSGAPPDSCDYDKRSALHIAGAEGNLAAVKLLIEEGGADPNFQDRWGNTALDEARRVGATPVVSYLEGLLGSEQLMGSGVRYRQKVATDFLAACGTGDLSRARYIAHNSRPGCIFTGLVLASTKGHKDVAELLLAWVQPDLLRSEGHMALVAAARMGHSAVVAALRSNGVQLPDPRDPILLAHVRAAVLSVDVRAVAALLAAGVDVRAAEGSALLHSAASTGSLEMVRRLVEEGGIRPNAEDSAGKTPAAVAEAAKLTAIADYLRWATSAAAGASAAAAAGASNAAAAAAAAVQSLCAAATTKYGQLSDYACMDSHDHISHGVTATDALLETDEDDGEPPPPLLARMNSMSSVASSRRMTALGTISRQSSLPRGNALWRLSSMARMAANSQTGEPTDPGDAPAPVPRRQRRASLTQFLSGHRVDGITVNTAPGLTEAELAAFLANADPDIMSGPFSGGSRAHSNHTGRKGSSTGFAMSVVSVGSAAGARGRSSATGMSGLSGELAGLTGLNADVAVSTLKPVVMGTMGSFTMNSRGGAGVDGGAGAAGALPAGRPLSRPVGAPLLPPPGPQGSAPTTASTSMAQTEQSFSRARPAGSVTAPAAGPPSGLRGGHAAGSPRPLSPPTPPEGSKEGAAPRGAGDALESFLQVAPSAFSASRLAALPGDGGGGGPSSASGGTRALGSDDLSHRTLENQLTALSPPER